MKKKKLVSPAERRSHLDQAKKDEMLAILIRNEDAFQQVREVLTDDHLKDISEGHALLWNVVNKFYKKYGHLPAKGTLMAELHDACNANPDLLGEEELGGLDDLVNDAFSKKVQGVDLSKSAKHTRIGIDTCKTFIEECLAREHRDALYKDGTVPQDIQEINRQFQDKLAVVGSLTGVEIEVPFPEGWDERDPEPLFSTGCTALDEFMGGGWKSPEILLFMGPYGSCKTALTIHCCAELIKKTRTSYRLAMAAYEKTKADAIKRKKQGKKYTMPEEPKRPVVILIFTEGSKRDYQLRLLSHMARIPWKRLMTIGVMSKLCSSDKIGALPETHYEKAEYLKNDSKFRCETRRVKIAASAANQHLVLIDCTDSPDSPYQLGKGGIPELANVIRAYLRANKDVVPLAVFIDHASALADRIAESVGADADDKMHLLLKRMPRQAADRIAKPFGVPVAIMHQLSGEANSKGSLSKMHHSMAAGSKSIGEYVDWAILTGKPDGNQMAKFDCTKHRREPAMSFKIVEIRGQFNEIVDRSGTHTINASNTQIVTKQEEHETHTAFSKALNKAAGNGSDTVDLDV